MSPSASSKQPRGGRAGLKALITIGALASTAFGWFLYGQPSSSDGAAVAQAGASLPPGWADLLAPLPTLVPLDGAGSRQDGQGAQPVLRSVSLPVPAPVVVTVTRSSR